MSNVRANDCGGATLTSKLSGGPSAASRRLETGDWSAALIARSTKRRWNKSNRTGMVAEWFVDFQGLILAGAAGRH